MHLVVLVHAAATWAMVGFIWTIQVLHYPLMGRVPADAFGSWVEAHQRRVVAVLAVFAVVEVVSAAAIGFVTDVPSWLSLGSGAVLAAIWVGTAAFYAPLHGRLAAGWDADLHARLVRSNWLRTIGWSIRGVAAGAMVLVTTN